MKITIGLEIHIKLSTPNKLFCRCENIQDFVDLEPNTHICPVCTAQPGALPTVSMECIDKAVQLGKLLNCTIQDGFYFDRKNYFYPDLVMGYQITQLSRPININGQVNYWIDNYKTKLTAKITQAHLENDTAKSIHSEGMTLIDWNRSGTPLVEIVTGPDFHSHEEVVDFLKELQRLIKWNNIGSADLDKGQMRVDVNVSISPDETLGTRVEIKNINTFASIRNAINYEVSRQTELLAKGEKVMQETRRRNDPTGMTIGMRSKEDAHDYRYFPEPDILPIHIVNHDSDNNLENRDNLTCIVEENLLKEKEYRKVVDNDELYNAKDSKTRENKLYYYGDMHKTDFEDLDYQKIKKYIYEFYDKHKGEKNIFMVEGGENRPKIANVDKGNGTTPQFVIHYADKLGIEYISPEPKYIDEIEYCRSKGFIDDEICYHYFARLIRQYHTSEDDRNIYDFIDYNFSKKDFEFYNIYNRVINFDEIEKIHKKLFKNEIDLTDFDFFGKMCDPFYDGGRVCQACNCSMVFRDINICQKVVEYIEKGYNVFTVYGRGHLVTQELFFDKYFAQNAVKSEDSSSLNNQYIPATIISQMLDRGFNKEYINGLIQSQDIYIYFRSLVDKGIDPKTAAKWIVGSLMSYCTNSEISTSKISLDKFTAFVQDVIKYNLKDTNAKIALETMVEENTDSQSAISKHGFDKVEEIDYIGLSHQAMDANPAIVEQYRSGKTPVIMFLVGQIMKLSGGKADATAAKQALEIELAK